MSMDGTFISELVTQLRQPQMLNGRTYLPHGWAVERQANIDALVIDTLTSMRDYLESNVDDLDMDNLIIHVTTPTKVVLYGKLEDESKLFRRQSIMASDCIGNAFKFGEWMGIESFIIGVMTQFVDTMQRADMLKIVSSVKDVEELSADDDGVSQEVSAKAGAAVVQRFAVKNPVYLAPYRCFREVDQPLSPFVLRLKRVKDQPPQCALFECDGGRWKLDAIEALRAWFQREVPKVAVIA